MRNPGENNALLAFAAGAGVYLILKWIRKGGSLGQPPYAVAPTPKPAPTPTPVIVPTIVGPVPKPAPVPVSVPRETKIELATQMLRRLPERTHIRHEFKTYEPAYEPGQFTIEGKPARSGFDFTRTIAPEMKMIEERVFGEDIRLPADWGYPEDVTEELKNKIRTGRRDLESYEKEMKSISDEFGKIPDISGHFRKWRFMDKVSRELPWKTVISDQARADAKARAEQLSLEMKVAAQKAKFLSNRMSRLQEVTAQKEGYQAAVAYRNRDFETLKMIANRIASGEPPVVEAYRPESSSKRKVSKATEVVKSPFRL